MGYIDPDVAVDDQAQSFVIMAVVRKSDGKPYPLRQSATGGLIMSTELPSVLSGKSFTLTGGVDQLPAFACKAGGSLFADDGNAADIWVGGSDVAINDGYKLLIGGSVPIATGNLNLAYVIGTIGDKIHYLVG